MLVEINCLPCLYGVDVHQGGTPACEDHDEDEFLVSLKSYEGRLSFWLDRTSLEMLQREINREIDGEGKLRCL